MDNNGGPSLIELQLKPGERLMWYSAPNPWRAVAGFFFILALCSFFTGLVAFAAVFAAVKGQTLPKFIFLLILGGAVGCFLALANILDCWKTAYGLTDSRLIIAVGKGGWWRSTKSYCPEDMEPLMWTGDKNWGSVYFGEGPGVLGGEGSRFKGALYGIAHPTDVIALINETLLDKHSRLPR